MITNRLWNGFYKIAPSKWLNKPDVRALEMYIYLIRKCKKTNECYIYPKKIASRLRVHYKTVFNKLKILSDAGLIKREVFIDKKGKTSNKISILKFL